MLPCFLLLVALGNQDPPHSPAATQSPAAAEQPVDWASSGFRYQDAEGFAALWGVPVDQAQQAIVEMVNTGQRQVLEQTLQDMQKGEPALALQAFGHSDHDLCDAKVMADLWSEGVEQSKLRIGDKLLGGHGPWVLEQLAEAHEGEREPPECVWEELKYSAKDAQLVAALWGSSASEAQARMTQKVNAGERAQVEEVLWNARNPSPPFPPREPWKAQAANAGIRAAAACIRDPNLGQETGPAPVCAELLSGTAGMVRGPEHGVQDGMMHAEIKLLQPDGSWLKLEEIDGSFHGFLWVPSAHVYLGYASWYGEYGTCMLVFPGSTQAVQTHGVPVFSPDGGTVAAAQFDPYRDDVLELTAYAIDGFKTTTLFDRRTFEPKDFATPKQQENRLPDFVQGMRFVDATWIRVDLGVQEGAPYPVWISAKDGALRSSPPEPKAAQVP